MSKETASVVNNQGAFRKTRGIKQVFTRDNMMLEGYQVTLRSVEVKDLELLRSWRNQPSVSEFMLSQEIISKKQQRAWFKKISQDPSQQHFIIEYKGTPIGSANIKSCDQGKALEEASNIEPGLYIADTKYRNNILAFAPTLVLNDYCFYTLHADKLVAVVKATNQAALNYNAKLGYRSSPNKRVSDGLVDITLGRQDYDMHTQHIKALLSRSGNRK